MKIFYNSSKYTEFKKLFDNVLRMIPKVSEDHRTLAGKSFNRRTSPTVVGRTFFFGLYERQK